MMLTPYYLHLPLSFTYPPLSLSPSTHIPINATYVTPLLPIPILVLYPYKVTYIRRHGKKVYRGSKTGDRYWEMGRRIRG